MEKKEKLKTTNIEVREASDGITQVNFHQMYLKTSLSYLVTLKCKIECIAGNLIPRL